MLSTLERLAGVGRTLTRSADWVDLSTTQIRGLEHVLSLHTRSMEPPTHSVILDSEGLEEVDTCPHCNSQDLHEMTEWEGWICGQCGYRMFA